MQGIKLILLWLNVILLEALAMKALQLTFLVIETAVLAELMIDRFITAFQNLSPFRQFLIVGSTIRTNLFVVQYCLATCYRLTSNNHLPAAEGFDCAWVHDTITVYLEPPYTVSYILYILSCCIIDCRSSRLHFCTYHISHQDDSCCLLPYICSPSSVFNAGLNQIF